MNKSESVVARQESKDRETIQRNIARMAEENAELVAVATMAFVNGLQIGHARANADPQ